jgi:hypothetical protein
VMRCLLLSRGRPGRAGLPGGAALGAGTGRRLDALVVEL